MPAQIIAKNLTDEALPLRRLSVPNAELPAYGQAVLTDYNHMWEIQEDVELRSYIELDKVLLTVNGVDLTKDESQNAATAACATSGVRTDSFNFAQLNTPYIYIQGETYQVVGYVIFPGTLMGAPTAIKAVAGAYGGGTGYIRVYDTTNGKTIAEKAFLDGFPSVIDLGELSNLPADEAVWEIQMKEVSAISVRLGALVIKY